MELDVQYMQLALEEAKKGLGRTSPNPCVGAVVVKDNTLVSVGYHEKAGTPHAEVHALREAGAQARGATIYVTLEPCSHTGRTPPCSQAIVESGIAKVVMGMRDPNPLVDGSGIDYLRTNGVEVISGILEQECREINFPFIKFITSSLPWFVMKAGLSLDGRLNYQRGKSGWITGPESGVQTHILRDIYDAILVGVETIHIDDPSLTTRRSEASVGRDPIRIILDTQLRTPTNAKVLNLTSNAPTWIFCGDDVDSSKVEALNQCGARIFSVKTTLKGHLDLQEVAKELGRQKVCSVLVEGGAKIHGAMLRERLIDYVQLFQAPLFAGDGGVSLFEGFGFEERAEAFSLKNVRYRRLGEDQMIEGCLKY